MRFKRGACCRLEYLGLKMKLVIQFYLFVKLVLQSVNDMQDFIKLIGTELPWHIVSFAFLVVFVVSCMEIKTDEH